jgi:hypothetical protein
MKRFLIFTFLIAFAFRINGQYAGVVASQNGSLAGGESTLLDKIIAAYDLEESSGAAIDAVGSADMTNHGATQHVSGKTGYAVTFTGTESDYMGTVDATFELQVFSVSCWIKHTEEESFHAIVDNRHWDNGITGWSIMTCYEAGCYGGIDFTICNGGANNLELYQTTDETLVNDGNWHNIVVTFSGTHIDLYVDGALEIDADWAHTISYTGDNLFSFGSSSGGAELFYTGSLDKVYIFDEVLTPTEVIDLQTLTYPFE